MAQLAFERILTLVPDTDVYALNALFALGRHYEAKGDWKRAADYAERGYNAFSWNVQAELQYFEEQLSQGTTSDLGRLMALRDLSRRIAGEHSRLLEDHLREDHDGESGS